MAESKEIQGIEVYSSPRRGEVYVDYKGERILSIPDVPMRICKDEGKTYDFAVNNYSDVIQDCIHAIEGGN